MKKYLKKKANFLKKDFTSYTVPESLLRNGNITTIPFFLFVNKFEEKYEFGLFWVFVFCFFFITDREFNFNLSYLFYVLNKFSLFTFTSDY